jgi:2-desacetyl-2-hydroxyethyl bacteriochlorophyllide A dehydrogenase
MMDAIILDHPGRLVLGEMPVPDQPGPGEALVRIRCIGVCGTDLHAFRGEQPFFSYPRILGHELGVEVVSVGEGVTHVVPGTPCALEPYFSCGHCHACRRGKTNCCETLKVFGVHIDGGMRPSATVPAHKLHPAPTLSYEQLALVEPLSIGAHAVARGRPEAGERVLVVGAGPIGLAVIQFALLEGAEVLVLDVSESRLAFCRSQWPQVVCLDARGDTLATLKQYAGTEMPTAVFDATGNQASMASSFGFIANGGRLIFVGLFVGDVTFHDPDFHRRETTLLSSRNALAGDFQRVIGHLEAGHINLAPWITHRAHFDGLIEAFPGWFDRESGLIKAVVFL